MIITVMQPVLLAIIFQVIQSCGSNPWYWLALVCSACALAWMAMKGGEWLWRHQKALCGVTENTKMSTIHPSPVDPLVDVNDNESDEDSEVNWGRNIMDLVVNDEEINEYQEMHIEEPLAVSARIDLSLSKAPGDQAPVAEWMDISDVSESGSEL